MPLTTGEHEGHKKDARVRMSGMTEEEGVDAILCGVPGTDPSLGIRMPIWEIPADDRRNAGEEQMDGQLRIE